MAYTFTFSNLDSVKVNGNTVTSPYTLQNGDVIIAKKYYVEDYNAELDRTTYYNGKIICNGTNYDGVTQTLELKNIDIVLQGTSGSGGTSSSFNVSSAELTINYIEKSNIQIDINSNGTTILATKSTKVEKDIDINVEVEPNLEEKTVSITSNGTTTIVPSNGKDGLSKVVVNANIQSYITVASEADLPATAEEGTIAIVEAS